VLRLHAGGVSGRAGLMATGMRWWNKGPPFAIALHHDVQPRRVQAVGRCSHPPGAGFGQRPGCRSAPLLWDVSLWFE